MGIMLPPQNAAVREQAKWETQPVMIGDTMIMPLSREEGGRGPYAYQPYPRMLYKAARPAVGPVAIVANTIAHDEGDQRRKLSDGWHPTQEDAIAAVHARDQDAAVMAANRHFHERRMSENAQAEALAVEETSSVHLGEIPETPIKRRGRPRKAASV